MLAGMNQGLFNTPRGARRVDRSDLGKVRAGTDDVNNLQKVSSYSLIR